MKLRANQFGLLQEHRPAAPVLIGSLRSRCEGRRSMRVSGRFAVAAQVCILSCAQPLVATPFRLAFVRTATRPASARAQRLLAPIVMRSAQAFVAALLTKGIEVTPSAFKPGAQPRSFQSLDAAR